MVGRQPNNGNNVNNNHHNEDALNGLKAAAYIAKSLSNSKDKKLIVEKFNGDEQLVEMWTSFICHNGWVNKDIVRTKNIIRGKWQLTDKGTHWVNSLIKGLAVMSQMPLIFLFIDFDPAAIFPIS